jgi:predicted Zn-dependent protease
VQTIEPPDSHHLDGALGWLGLGCVGDAREELERISTANRNHPVVLETRWMICSQEKNWTEALATARAELAAVPGESTGWLHYAYALRRADGGGLPQAWEALLPAADKFPQEPVIAYNLSCYACQMEQWEASRTWLRRAIQAGDKEAIKKMALADDDLQSLWEEIRKW